MLVVSRASVVRPWPCVSGVEPRASGISDRTSALSSVTRVPKPLYAWTEKEQAFVRAYSRHGNASRAVREAGYNVGSPNVARSIGHELVRKPHIKQHLEEQRELALQQSDISPGRILREVALIAFANPANILCIEEQWNDPKDREKGGAPDRVVVSLDISLATEADLRAIGAIKETDQGLQVTFHSKLSALEMLGKYHKLWIDRVELGADEELSERLRRGRERARLALEQQEIADG
jgi:phage terminase small subunit